MESICRRYSVSGRVQGVFFRDSTQREAQRLGLHGFVRNRLDGTVEVAVCGPESRVAELVSWLWKGPPAARVDAVTELRPPDQTWSSFDVLPTS